MTEIVQAYMPMTLHTNGVGNVLTYTERLTRPLLLIHGGPNGQDQHSFHYEREVFAANGYIVLAVNYRGSNGRGGWMHDRDEEPWNDKWFIRPTSDQARATVVPAPTTWTSMS